MSAAVPFPVEERRLAVMFNRVRDATVRADDCSMAEKIAVLELVKAELIRDALEDIHG